MFTFSGVNCTWSWLSIVERKDPFLSLQFPTGGDLQVTLYTKQPSIWNITNMTEAAWNSQQRVPFIKLHLDPKIYIYTQGPGKKTSKVTTPSQGGQMRAQSPLLGHGPSTHSVLSDSLCIYCPRIDHVSFFKCSFSPWATSQNNGCHMLTFHHRNKLFDFIYHKRNESSWNSTKFCDIFFQALVNRHSTGTMYSLYSRSYVP